MIRDLKLLVEGLQKTKSDEDGQEYSMRAEGMLATAIAVFRRLSQLMSSPSIYLPWLIPYGKILHSHLSSFNPSSLPLDPLDTSTTPAAHLKRSTATSAFLRAVSLRLSYISSITVEGGVPVFEEGFKPQVCDFQEFVQSGYVLSGVDNGACFEMLWLAECLFDRVEKKEFDEVRKVGNGCFGERAR
ncbi:hypothetical protein TL16_g06207 [Triparma laevis f. inornata]|uniref:Uncharacterized protein n=1 Tax=Triparma laevis f. inornata TaxID=1714386 RepID=A0A9W7AQZ0_9STRA|nr:hypothetical protein TL16_g06207 [Triparma laevis f. inornata]